MTYLTICTGGAQPARRVNFAHYADLFAVPEAEPLPRPRRRSRLPLVAAPVLLAVLAADIAMIARPAAPACASQVPQPTRGLCAATPS